MKTRTKILSILLVLAMLLTLTACAKDTPPASAPDNKPGDSTGDINTAPDEPGDDLPYWNGFNFGPNLSYDEEYKSQGDPGEYLNAAEGAKLTFDKMKAGDHIPGDSDKFEYTMVLSDLADIEGEECYIYRLEVDKANDPAGTVGAAYAYAYQSGHIYMQGAGGQWLLME